MEPATLQIEAISRRLPNSQSEPLQFVPGVNLIVGPANAGKTKWLETLDYLLADDISAAERAEDPIFTKYVSANGVLRIAGEQFTIERAWNEPGVLNKVFVNRDAMPIRDYRALIMQKLGIPIVHYPQGNPYGPRTWPELGWRSLVRHIYRRQRHWNDIADQQPEVEQHACLMQFLGVAERVFSPDYGDLVSKEKKIAELEFKREQFVQMLQEVTRDLVASEDLGVALTPESLNAAGERIHTEEAELIRQRDTILVSLRSQEDSAPDRLVLGESSQVEQMSERLVATQQEREAVLTALKKTQMRQSELTARRDLLEGELARLQRAAEAGAVFADLKVTHCPACDQEIGLQDGPTDACYVCKQPIRQTEVFAAAEKRIEFEREQIASEIQETNELLSQLALEIKQLGNDSSRLSDEAARIQQALRPVRRATAAILPPELTLIEMNIGRLQEQVRQLQRLRSSLSKRETLAAQIQELQAQTAALQASVSAKTADLDYSTLGDWISDGMNDYLTQIKKLNPNSWTAREVAFQLSENGFQIKVGGGSWKRKLGGTLTLYLLLAYQYALLNLTLKASARFPGLIILDFPAELEDGTSIADKENFVVQPFIDFLSRHIATPMQVIAAGSAFEGLQVANRIELKHIWKE
jgi:hypothetical protein